MRFLLDTHLLLWAAGDAGQLSQAARALILDPNTVQVFSVVSVWKVAIKRSLDRPHFRTDSRVRRLALLATGYEDMPVTGAHAIAVQVVPPIHEDPFDRLFLAQASVDGITLATADPILARCPGSVARV